MFAFFGKNLENAIGALCSVKRGRSGSLDYFYPIDHTKIKGIDIGGYPYADIFS